MLNELRRAVCKANKELWTLRLVLSTWGNVSGFDPATGLFVIKPSGVPYDELQPEQMVVMSLDGQKVEGRLSPSSDADTHRALYAAWPAQIGGIVHTHSTFATAFAQACRPVEAMSTTHADSFCGPIPLTRPLTHEEVDGEYEKATACAILEAVADPEAVPAVLVRWHGVFTWGKTCADAVMNAAVAEEVAKMTYLAGNINPEAKAMPDELLRRHFYRRNGPDATYGQR